VYGLKPQSANNHTVFQCLKYNSSFIVQDSLEVIISSSSVNDYLEVEADTIHNSLNFFFQKSNQEEVKVLRLSSKPELISVSENVKANHIKAAKLNAIHTVYDDKHLYTITNYSDSLSTQFYLNKYKLFCDANHFEYELDWQYPFERQNIKDILIQYVDSVYLLLYAMVVDGVKKGEWILKIDNRKGDLIKGTKLNLKGENKFYFPPLLSYHQKTKHVLLVGNTTSANAFNYKTNEVLSKTHLNTLYVFEVDSLMEINKRFEKTIPIPQALSVQAKTNSILFNPIQISVKSEAKFEILNQVYALNGQSASYISSWLVDLVFQDDEYMIEPLSYYSINFDSKSKSIITDKIDFTSANSYYQFFQQKRKLPLLEHRFSSGKPLYVILKNDINDNSFQYYKCSLGQKALECGMIEKVSKEYFPNYFYTGFSILFKRSTQFDKAVISIYR
jgi:hypothetical protein